jgi:hypothetical protein
LAIGLQWFALQSVAWTVMMIRNARQVSFCNAVKRTFDGAHPCSLCQIVNKGKSSEQKRDLHAPNPKIDIICVARPIRLLPSSAALDYASVSFRNSEIEYSPPSPPPRSLLS